MNKQDRIEELKKIGVAKELYVLPDLIEDSNFQNLLNPQEINVLQNLKQNLRTVTNYSGIVADIVSKYYGYKISKDVNLNSLEEKVNSLEGKISESKKSLEEVENFAEVAKGAGAMKSYAKIFKTRATRHKEKADIQFKYYLISLFSLLLITWMVFFFNVVEFNFVKNIIAEDILFKFNIGIFTFKILLLIFIFQISQFFKKSYNAEKHLEEVYSNRSDVLNSLHAVYVSIENPVEKDRLLSIGATFAYERGETGYITTKEGAGGDDDYIANLISRLLSK
ncbi:hypothetical protein H6775_03405 [Candidatus Nomurabacteria bacterium]|nr:hypothetical protein [Candidatus Nomurabacteria bacterium]